MPHKNKTMKKHNFSAGPAILPQSVLAEASEAVKDFQGVGLSILEMSHRSAEFTAVMEEAQQLVKQLYHLPDNYKVLFLTGGASSQFYMVPMNLLPQSGSASYVNTGTWSTKAIKEVSNFGTVKEIASSKDKGFSYYPKGYEIPEDSAYLHLTSNNTICGTQIKHYPDTNVPIVCDMSSDIFSKSIDYKRFGVIYAGAQKNLGPAGTTLVIVNEDLLGKTDRSIPTMLDYRTHVAKNSMFNTPPAYPVYVCLLTLRWIVAQGGLEAMQANNEAKAGLLYNEIDSNPLFKGVAASEDRSLMNVTFVLENKDLESAFLAACTEANISGVKGHRSVGGFRASIYNAMPKSSVQVLVDLMKEFTRTHG